MLVQIGTKPLCCWHVASLLLRKKPCRNFLSCLWPSSVSPSTNGLCSSLNLYFMSSTRARPHRQGAANPRCHPCCYSKPAAVTASRDRRPHRRPSRGWAGQILRFPWPSQSPWRTARRDPGGCTPLTPRWTRQGFPGRFGGGHRHVAGRDVLDTGDEAKGDGGQAAVLPIVHDNDGDAASTLRSDAPSSTVICFTGARTCTRMLSIRIGRRRQSVHVRRVPPSLPVRE